MYHFHLVLYTGFSDCTWVQFCVSLILALFFLYGVVYLCAMFLWQPQSQQHTPCKHHVPPLLHQPQFNPVHQNHHPQMHQGQHAAQYSQSHQCGPPSHLPEIGHAHHSPTMSQHMACLALTGGHVGGRLHVLVRLS